MQKILVNKIITRIGKETKNGEIRLLNPKSGY